MEELHRVGDNLWAVAGDGVVLAFDDLQGGGGAVCLQVAFAAPKGHNVVAVAVLQQHRSMVGRGGAVDVELLRADKVFAPQLVEAPATDIFRRVGGVEPFGQRHLIGNIAFRTVNEDFLRATGRQRLQSQHYQNGANNKLSHS